MASESFQVQKQMDDFEKLYPNGGPRMHIYTHQENPLHMFNLLPVASATDGEAVERRWVDAARSLISVPHPFGFAQINPSILQKRILDLTLMQRPSAPMDIQRGEIYSAFDIPSRFPRLPPLVSYDFTGHGPAWVRRAAVAIAGEGESNLLEVVPRFALSLDGKFAIPKVSLSLIACYDFRKLRFL
uniref:Uncharacterized protein n=1 Tax=Mycena chlorophos TaxID=658473 RepID=A0ABQ0KZY4_MYCCL|nr:predicted protein [Mycena chlorophos]